MFMNIEFINRGVVRSAVRSVATVSFGARVSTLG